MSLESNFIYKTTLILLSNIFYSLTYLHPTEIYNFSISLPRRLAFCWHILKLLLRPNSKLRTGFPSCGIHYPTYTVFISAQIHGILKFSTKKSLYFIVLWNQNINLCIGYFKLNFSWTTFCKYLKDYRNIFSLPVRGHCIKLMPWKGHEVNKLKFRFMFRLYNFILKNTYPF